MLKLDIENVKASNKISSGEKKCKHFIGYLYNDYKVKPFHIMLPKTSAYVTSLNGETKFICVLNEDHDLLVKYNTIWDKVSADINREFDSKPFYNKKILKTKTTSYYDEVTDFYDK